MILLRFLGRTVKYLCALYLLPFLLFGLLIWSPVAWLLDLLFPDQEFYPIGKAWPRICEWTMKRCGINLTALLVIGALIMLASSVIGWIVGLLCVKSKQ